MSSFLSTIEEIPDESIKFHHYPGSVFTYECSINRSPVLEAFCLLPYGSNNRKINPILIFFKIEGKYYSPLTVINKYLLTKSDKERKNFTLYSEEDSLRVFLTQPVEDTDGIPVACLIEGQDKQPDTFIKTDELYGDFIHNISSGKLSEAIKNIKENKEAVLKAYPYLTIIVNNLEKVFDNASCLEYLKREKKIPEEIITFQGVSEYFERLYKNEQQKGILPKICKTFCFIPYS